MPTQRPSRPSIWPKSFINFNINQKSLSHCICVCLDRRPHLSSAISVKSRTPDSHSSRIFAIIIVVMLLLDVTLACGPGRGGGRRRHPRKLTPLVFKQHVPNVSENTLGASGLNEGKVSKDNQTFKELVPNYNSDIIFKDEEGTGADRLMTQRLKEKLNTLAISVMNQWPGVKLRVTEGWDEEGHHAIDSLHYEGRAVDITTSDRDRSKYGMLARLAVEAGFDWVYYESRFHIHCSVKSEKSESTRSGGCFESNSLVFTPKGSITITDVKIGDEILAVDSDGNLKFSEVLLFLDRDPLSSRLYYQIETESGSKISLTPSHLIFVSDHNSTQFRKQMNSRAEFAKNVQKGQFLYTSSLGDNKMNKSMTITDNHQSNKHFAYLDRVVSVETKLGIGAYAPLTREGNLIVNNIIASCYAVINDQSIAHWSFLPIRLLDNIKHSFESITYLLNIRQLKSTKSLVSSHQNGVHWYPKMLYSLSKYIIPYDKMY